MSHRALGSVLRYLYGAVGPDESEGPSDGQLLARFVTGRDETAFETLLARHAGVVWQACRRVLADDADAQDAFQATFLVLLRKASEVDGSRSLAGWLYGVAYRVALKARARGIRRREIERQAPPMNAAPLADDLRPLLDAELATLPEKYRAPLVLCYLQGKTNEQAARELGQAPGSMSKVLARGRELLRERLLSKGAAVSSALLVSVLEQSSASAAVPPPMTAALLRAASEYVSGHAAGGFSASAAALAEGVVNSMLMSRLKTMALMLMAAVLIAGAAAFLHQAFAARPLAPLPEVAVPLQDPLADAKAQRIRFTTEHTIERQQTGFSLITLGHFPLDDFNKGPQEQIVSKPLAVLRGWFPLEHLKAGKTVDLFLVGPEYNTGETLQPVILQRNGNAFTILLESWNDNGGRDRNAPGKDAHLLSLGTLPAGDYTLNVVWRKWFQDERKRPDRYYECNGQSAGTLAFQVPEAAAKDVRLPVLNSNELKAGEIPAAIKNERRQRPWINPVTPLQGKLDAPEVRAGTFDVQKWLLSKPRQLEELPKLAAPGVGSKVTALLLGPPTVPGQQIILRDIAWKGKQVTVRVDVWLDEDERRKSILTTPLVLASLDPPRQAVENILGTIPGEYEVIAEWTLLRANQLNVPFRFDKVMTSRTKITVK